MIDVDGSYGEGGGQVLRTSLALSAVANNAVRIFNIRAGRQNPGLQAQHLEALNAMEQLCDADVDGAKLRSTEVVFRPNGIAGGKIKINIPTAGSIGLVLQPLMIAGVHSDKPLSIEINGGATNGKWAMPANYAKHVLIPLLKKMNYSASLEIKRYGYYPKGGADVFAEINPAELQPVQLIESGEITEIFGISHASDDLKSKMVAERQAKAADTLVEKNFPLNAKMHVIYDKTLCAGSAIDIFAKTENSVIGATGLGELRKKAEDVGKEGAQNLVNELRTGACVDQHAGDQLIPYMALARGESVIKPSRVTEHMKTNIWVTEKFLPVKFSVENEIIRCKAL